MRVMIRLLLFTFGILAALPLLALLALLPSTPITPVGALYLLGGILIVAGLISAPWWRRGSPTLALLGALLIVAIAALRMVFPPSGSRLILTSLPSQSGAHWLNRIFDEQDVVLFGARVGLQLGFISPAENNGLVPALAEMYSQMHEMTPLSPFLVTYLNRNAQAPLISSLPSRLETHGLSGELSFYTASAAISHSNVGWWLTPASGSGR